ncbi:MAG: TrkH family potassium uptake protein [Candidatus Aminicenantales bacterium]
MRRRIIFRQKRFQPARVLAFSFLVAIVAGTILLLLPISTVSGRIPLIDALFTATSAVCVTGLTAVETATYFSFFGQVIILIMIQLGGLGIMTFSTMILLAAGRRVSFQDRMLVQESFFVAAPKDFRTLIRNIFLMTFSIELIGAGFLFLRLSSQQPWPKSFFNSLFHSVSAFCNAGFSTFSNSLQAFTGDILVNLTIIALIILGGLGFLVNQELFYLALKRPKRFHFSLHSKLVFRVTGLLIVGSFVVFFWLENNYGLKGYGLKEKILASLFQVITPRTAGFNTIDLRSLQAASVFLLTGLMFVGASPGSTGGGIKTVTLGVVMAFLKSKMAAREKVGVFQRTIPDECLTRAFTLFFLAFSWVALASFFVLIFQPSAMMKEAVFEVFSAFGTVGLSLGITPELTPLSKLVLILTMYVGRIGPLTLLAVFSRTKPAGQFAYVEETVMIG